MADEGAKPKAKARREAPSVLSALPTSRPERLGKPRASAAPKPRKPAARSPRAIRPAATPLTPPEPAEPPPLPIGAPTGTELVTTAIRAVGELAQIGAGAGARALKGAVRRLPKP